MRSVQHAECHLGGIGITRISGISPGNSSGIACIRDLSI